MASTLKETYSQNPSRKPLHPNPIAPAAAARFESRAPSSGAPEPAASKGRFPSYKDLEIWRHGMDVACASFVAFQSCQAPELRERAQRSALSIPSEIAAGFELRVLEDFTPYLISAKARCAEVRTCVEAALQLQWMAPETGAQLSELTSKLGAMLFKFIKSRRESGRDAAQAPGA